MKMIRRDSASGQWFNRPLPTDTGARADEKHPSSSLAQRLPIKASTVAPIQPLLLTGLEPGSPGIDDRLFWVLEFVNGLAVNSNPLVPAGTSNENRQSKRITSVHYWPKMRYEREGDWGNFCPLWENGFFLFYPWMLGKNSRQYTSQEVWVQFIALCHSNKISDLELCWLSSLHTSVESFNWFDFC